jgi:hypothetical protein
MTVLVTIGAILLYLFIGSFVTHFVNTRLVDEKARFDFKDAEEYIAYGMMIVGWPLFPAAGIFYLLGRTAARLWKK